MDSIIVKMSANNWTLSEPLSEQIAQNASTNLCYLNKIETTVNVLFFPDENILRVRAFDGHNKNWLEIKPQDNNIDEILNVLIEEQDNISQDNWFSFYFKISSVCSAAILAWEQFENVYR
jgi:hypothetical protein